jgi:hypothetical protein
VGLQDLPDTETLHFGAASIVAPDMTPPKLDTVAQNTNPKNGAAAQAVPPPASTAPAAAARKAKDKLKPVTIQLSEDVHKKLRIVALSKGATASGLVESYVDAALRRDLAVALSKLTDE